MCTLKHRLTIRICICIFVALTLAAFLPFVVSASTTDSIIYLDSANDIYTLSRILANKYVQKNYLYSTTSGYDRAHDLAAFTYPEDCVTDAEKIHYLTQASYCLTADLSVTLSVVEGYFLGIGSTEHVFSGNFDGNGHTITIYCNNEISLNSITGGYVGLFPIIKNATVQNLQIHVANDILVAAVSDSIAMGVLAARATNAEIKDCSVCFSHSAFGAKFQNADTKRQYASIGGLVGRLDSSVISNCHVVLDHAQLIGCEQEAAQLTQMEVGGFAGRILGDSVRSEVNDCSFYAIESSILNYTQNIGMSAAYTGNSSKTSYTNCSVLLDDSVIHTLGTSVNSTSMYSILSTGGIIGFSQPGSDNTTGIGAVGNHISYCTLLSTNSFSQNIILSQAETGSEFTAGGLVGCSFNNLRIDNSSVQIYRGTIAAKKTGLTDSTSTYGTQAGGIIGRMEHTGELLKCSVRGWQLNILSQSPNNQSSAGGIAGVDIGPYHKDVTSLNQCTFDGSNTTLIQVHITTAVQDAKKAVSVGGIVGSGSYRIENCHAKNVSVVCMTPEVTNPINCDTIAGYHNTSYSWWAHKTYFLPRKAEMVDSTALNVNANHILCEDQAQINIIKSVTRSKALSLEGVIYMRATIAFMNGEETKNASNLSTEQILKDGRILFWSERNMPENHDKAVLGTETECAALTDAGLYEGIQEFSGISHGIAAKEYRDTIYFRTYMIINGVEHYGPIQEYSVVTYCTNQIRNTKSSNTFRALLAAMLNYGAAAQNQFGYRTDKPANECLQGFVDQGLLDVAHLSVAWDEGLLTEPSPATAEMSINFPVHQVKRTNRTLALEGAINARIVFGYNVTDRKASPLPEGTTATFYYWTATSYAKLAAANEPLSKTNASYSMEGILNYTEEYGYEYFADSKGIAAKQLGDDLYIACVFTLPDGTEYTSGVEVYSPEVYAKSKLDAANTGTLAELLKAMVVYGEFASNFFSK